VLDTARYDLFDVYSIRVEPVSQGNGRFVDFAGTSHGMCASSYRIHVHWLATPAAHGACIRRVSGQIKRRSSVLIYLPQRGGLLAVGSGARGGNAWNWIEAIRYLNMEPLREQNKDVRRQIEDAA
jgi:hypothetical protein